jgi:hypothetical protein
MVHADLICVPQLMSGEQALAAQIGGIARGCRLRVEYSAHAVSAARGILPVIEDHIVLRSCLRAAHPRTRWFSACPGKTLTAARRLGKPQ